MSGMSALGVNIVEGSRLDARSLLSSMRYHRPAHLWNTNTLTLSIGVHALNKLMTICTSTFAASSTSRGCTIEARNVSAAYAAPVYLEGWMEWLDLECGFLRFFGPGLELVRLSEEGEEWMTKMTRC